MARQEIGAQQGDVRETINEAIRETREADRMEWHEENVKRGASGTGREASRRGEANLRTLKSSWKS